MGSVTKSQKQNIKSPDGNSLALFVDGNDGELKLKDVRGNIQKITEYLSTFVEDSLNPSVVALDVNDGITVTGTTANTLSQSVLIPANTFSQDGILEIMFRGIATATVSGSQFRMYKNTTNSLTGATLIANFGNSATYNYVQGIRSLRVISNTIFYMSTNLGASQDYVATGTGFQLSTTFNTSVDNYLIIAIQNANNGDSTKVNMIRATKYL